MTNWMAGPEKNMTACGEAVACWGSVVEGFALVLRSLPTLVRDDPGHRTPLRERPALLAEDLGVGFDCFLHRGSLPLLMI